MNGQPIDWRKERLNVPATLRHADETLAKSRTQSAEVRQLLARLEATKPVTMAMSEAEKAAAERASRWNLDRLVRMYQEKHGCSYGDAYVAVNRLLLEDAG